MKRIVLLVAAFAASPVFAQGEAVQVPKVAIYPWSFAENERGTNPTAVETALSTLQKLFEKRAQFEVTNPVSTAAGRYSSRSVKPTAPERPKIAILEPATTAVVAGQKESTTVQEASRRVIPRLIKESQEKFKPKWEVDWITFEEASRVQKEVLGDRLINSEFIPAPLMQQIADRLHCRYVVHSVVHELTGARSTRLTYQRTGRIVIDILVFDARENKYVWQDSRTQTSTRTDWFASSSLVEVQDQAFLNALREGLEPFILKGERKDVQTRGVGLVATVKSVFSEGKSVLLDVGADVPVTVGMEFLSLEGNCRLRVVEVLSNGTIAEVIEGVPAVGQVFKSTG
ncbi:MAG: hypothetical protein KatS3mg082_2974 [Nitrospiraceae bacterium]|nr:MAG: hypothetical protein KatS3mg015_1033 [Fimbriimonadales bacterium]GIW56541.1 MAG: hypothetical protein KatS3mg082_2945 [Nitrospiraceae bacterium]GIW56570.1 MAG: hypothetical protein KatS3mg082_2974 [Nitrospiraceae bacterium]